MNAAPANTACRRRTRPPMDANTRRLMRLHLIGVAAVCLLWVVGALYIVGVWRTIPSTVGCHFGPDGSFDIFWPKRIAFIHPLVAQAICMLAFAGFGFLALAVRPLRRISTKGNRLLRACTVAVCNVFSLTWAYFFFYWICCVCHQVPLCVTVGQAFLLAQFVAFCLLVLGYIVVAFVCRAPAPPSSPDAPITPVGPHGEAAAGLDSLPEAENGPTEYGGPDNE